MHVRKLFSLVLSLFAVLVISACSLGGSTGKTGKTLQTQEASLGSSGGDFQIGNLALSIGNSSIQSDAVLTLTEFQLPVDEGVEGQSSLFAVEGIPLDFSGMLQASLAIPDKILKNLDRDDPNTAQQLTFLFGTYGFSPSDGDYVMNMLPVEADIDLVAGVATVQVQVPLSLGMGSIKMAAPSLKRSAQSSETHLTANNFYFMIKDDGGREIAISDHFKVYYSKNIIALTSTTISPLMDALESTRSDILSMGFPWRQTEDNLKFPVYIQGCDKLEYIFWGKSTTTCAGEFRYTLVSGFHMVLPTETVIGDRQSMKAIIGHELMHYAQSVSHINDLAYTLETMARTGGARDWLLLDEATAVWYEKRITGDDDWLPDVAALNAEFYTQPWYFDTNSENTQQYGYGASWFVRYLEDAGGDTFIHDAYFGTGAVTGNEALATSIFLQTGTTIQTQFTNFLSDYLIDPADFSSALPGNQEFGNIYRPHIFLEASESQLDFKEFLITQDGRSGVNFINTPAVFNDAKGFDQPATASIDLTLAGGLTAYFFRMELPEETASWQEDAMITVQAVTDSGGGVMVYGLTGNFTDDATPLAGPVDYLSTGGRSSLVIPADEGYNQLAFILFNNTPPTSQTYAKVAVNISYGPARSATLTGEAYVTYQEYPQNYCDMPAGCYPYTNPPACVVAQSGGGGGGGGEGEPSEVVIVQPCPPLAEWCYWCSEYYHAAQMLGYNFYGDWVQQVEITIDEQGQVTEIQFPYGDAQLSGPDIQMTGGTTFEANWSFLDLGGQNHFTQWKMTGQVDLTGGSGTWTISFDGVGQLFSGNWSVHP